MKVEQIYTSCLSQGAYFIESNGEAAIIDPLRDVTEYIKLAKDNNSKIKYVFETHFHEKSHFYHFFLILRQFLY